MYRPEIGRFWSFDSYNGRPFEPLTLHKYAYANDDPVDHVDSTGRMSVLETQEALAEGESTDASYDEAVAAAKSGIWSVLARIGITIAAVTAATDVFLGQVIYGGPRWGDSAHPTDLAALSKRLRVRAQAVADEEALKKKMEDEEADATERGQPAKFFLHGASTTLYRRPGTDFGAGFYAFDASDPESWSWAFDWAVKSGTGAHWVELDMMKLADYEDVYSRGKDFGPYPLAAAQQFDYFHAVNHYRSLPVDDPGQSLGPLGPYPLVIGPLARRVGSFYQAYAGPQQYKFTYTGDSYDRLIPVAYVAVW